MLSGKSEFRGSKVHASTSVMLQGISRKLASHLPFSKSNVFSEGTGNSAIIHVFKRPKVIESDMLWRVIVVAYLFRAFEIQMTQCNG